MRTLLHGWSETVNGETLSLMNLRSHSLGFANWQRGLTKGLMVRFTPAVRRHRSTSSATTGSNTLRERSGNSQADSIRKRLKAREGRGSTPLGSTPKDRSFAGKT